MYQKAINSTPYVQKYVVVGKVAKCWDDNNWGGIGTATVICYPNGFCEIQFFYKSNATSSSTSFNYGLSVDALQTLDSNIPNIKSETGGYVQIFNATSKILDIPDNIASLFGKPVGTYSDDIWLLNRVYYTGTTYSAGGVQINTFPAGTFFAGVAVGTWSK